MSLLVIMSLRFGIFTPQGNSKVTKIQNKQQKGIAQKRPRKSRVACHEIVGDGSQHRPGKALLYWIRNRCLLCQIATMRNRFMRERCAGSMQRYAMRIDA